MSGWDADGLRTRREVLGDAHVDRSVAAADEFTIDFQQFITQNVWGSVWGRPGLDRPTRSVITVAVLTALRAEGELELHLRAAVRNGVTANQIKEVLLHVAAYAGVPAANTAFAIAARVLREEGALPRATSEAGTPASHGEDSAATS
ncbi:MAG TPA: 4-carboxymuconolactone decarboxylase [Micromonosporaceae bacterium]|jgi:4-carboxymuconolactone decarboxylase